MSNKNKLLKKNAPAKKTPKWFYLVLILLPLFLILIIEISLRVFGYGEDFETFTPLSKTYSNRLALNPKLTLKYFTNLNNYPTPLPDSFLKDKTKQTYRIFALGGSTTEGWPYASTGSFPAILKRRLELLYPEKNIEVINCGISAINTYTIRDIVPDIIKQKPDLVLFYGGHNEYYGALGVGSTVSMGSSRTLINFYVSISNFRTVQLINNTISKIYALFSNSEHTKNADKGTLMARVIGKSQIVLNSDLFNKGVDQFEGNLDDILKYLKEADIPVILGTLTSNLLDQQPFISIKTKELPRADIVYEKGKNEYDRGNYKEAHKLLFQAKELDALRFRAPQKFNDVIEDLGKKYNYPVIDIDSVFSYYSPNGIVGYNLTVDHLHPNLKGYKLMAKAFYKKMLQLNLLPVDKKIAITEARQDSLLDANFPFTRFDSTVAQIKLNLLTGSFPFVPKGTPNYKMINFKEKDYIDSLAIQFLRRNIFWQRAHINIADKYSKEKNYPAFIKEINSLIAMLPFDDSIYKYAAEQLISAKIFNQALVYLVKLESIKPSYYSKKWIGIINLQNKKYNVALKYLKEASLFSNADAQLWYNLSGTYYYNRQYENALRAIKRSLSINPKNKKAILYYNQLKSFTERLKK